MPPTLYHVPRTISSPIFQCLLELNLVDNPVKVVQMTFPALKSKEHLAINPMGTSPAFQDGGITMWESGAVLDYILERYDTSHTLHPTSIAFDSSPEEVSTRAKYLQIKQYIIATVYPFIASWYVHTLKPKDKQDEQYLRSAHDKWTTLLGPTLTAWLGEGPYFLGSKLSAVDLLAAKPLNNALALGLLDDDSFPALRSLLERIRTRPSFAGAYNSLVVAEASSSTHAAEPSDRTIVLVPSKEQRAQ